MVERLFHELEKEVNKKITMEIFVYPVIPGRDAFFDQPPPPSPSLSSSSATATPTTRKVIRKETITVNGKKKLIRRVYLFSSSYPDYRNIGWVVLSDVSSCMICSKEFSRFLSKRHKFHCHICGNIVCKDCLNGLVRIQEFDSGYVSACSNCYWGQDEVSIASNLGHNYSKVETPPFPSTTISTMQSTSTNQDFYTCYDIEEYEGPSTVDTSKLFPTPSFPHPTPQVLVPAPSPLSFYPRVDSLCYSDGLSRWSDTGSLLGESIQPSPTLFNSLHPSDSSSHLVTKNGNEEYFSETSESERGKEEDQENDEEIGEQEDEGEELEYEDDPLQAEQTANQAQLMLLLMSLSIATPSEMTEEEAREYNKRADQLALEQMSEEREI